MKVTIETKKEYTIVFSQAEKDTLCDLIRDAKIEWSSDMYKLADEMVRVLDPDERQLP
jgi:hypothetical protein